jgi:hypothetical protein
MHEIPNPNWGNRDIVGPAKSDPIFEIWERGCDSR